MRKVAIINFKGGTGKTTTVVNVGAGLAMRGKRVLLVDVDSQGSLAVSLGLKYKFSLADVLTQQITIQQARLHARPNLDLIPSDNSLLAAQRVMARFANWQDTVAESLASIEADYDFVLLDCAASLTPLNINALTYATEVFIPTQVEYLSLMGLGQVLENLARGRFPNQPRQTISDLGISLIIPTMYDVRKRQSRRLLAELRDTYGHHVSTPIRTNVRLSEAPSYHKTIYEHDPNCPGAFDYSRLVDTILQEALLAGEQPISLQRPFRPTLEQIPVPILNATPAASPKSATITAPPPPPIPMPVVATAPAVGPEPATITAPPPPAIPVPVAATAPAAGPEPATIPAPTPPAAASTPTTPAPVPHLPMSPLPNEPGASPHSLQCPYCNLPLTTFVAAGYRVYQCAHCGYQKQMLMRDLRVR
jgi:chromosome partitioning protein